MESSWKKRAGTFLKAQKRRKIWYRIVSVMAMAVVFVTTYLLILPAITMESKTVCGQAEHQHSGSCYSVQYPDPVRTLTCNTEALGIHRHTPACYDAAGSLICGYADFVIHTHDAACYDENGTLVCTLPETSLHVHTDACYQTERRLICTQEESAGHIHDTSCYTRQQGACTCALLEHTHNEACYGEEGNLICGQEEHLHTDSCYEWNEVLTCTVPESTGHTHTDACYETIAALVCTQPAELHTHTDACWQDGVLICGKIEVKEHQHTEVCFTETAQEPVNLLVCDIPEHIHTEECYEKTEAPLTEGTGTAAETEGTAAETQGGTVSETETGTLETPAGTTEAAETEEASDGSTILTVTAISAAGTVYDFEKDCFISELKIEFAMERDQIQSGRIYCYTCPEGIRIAEALAGQEEMLSDESGTAIGSCSFVRNENGTDSIQVVFDNGYVLNAGEAVSGSVAFAGEISVDLADADGQIAVESSGLTLLIPAEEISWGMDQAVVLDEEDADSANGNDSTAAETGNVLPVTKLSGEETKYDPETDQFTTKVRIDFQFTGKPTAGTAYTYKYPDGIAVPDDVVNKGAQDLYDGDKLAGTYRFIKNENGTYSVQIIFNEEYINGSGNTVTGYVQFEGTFDKEDMNEKGDIVVGADDATVLVPSKEITYPKDETESYHIDVSKSGSWVQDGDKLVYTVYVRTTKGTPELINFTDVITVPEDLTLGDPTVMIEKGTANYYYADWDNTWKPTDNNNWVEVGGITSVYESGELKLTLPGLSAEKTKDSNNSDCIIGDVYKITYTYLITDQTVEHVSPKNAVAVSAEDKTKGQVVTDTAESTVDVNKDFSYTLDKSGAVASDKQGYIKWTVTVNNNEVNIAGAKLTDEMLGLVEDMTNDIEISPNEGATINKDGNGKITDIVFSAAENGINKNKYTITYYTPVEEGWNGTTVTNTGTLDPNPDETGDEKKATASVTVSGVQLNKQGTYNGATNQIEWIITVNSGNLDIAGAVLTDTMFDDLSESNFTIEPTTGYSFTKDSDGKITGISFTAVDSGKNTQSYCIRYFTDVTESGEGTVSPVTNSATLSPGEGKEGEPIGSEATVTPEEVQLNKKGNFNWNGGIEWTITVNEGNRNIAGAVLTDTIFSQLTTNDITIKDGNWQEIFMDSGQYTIETDDTDKIKKITFNAIDNTGINTNKYIITYNTAVLREWNDKNVHNEAKLTLEGKEIPGTADVLVPADGSVSKSAGTGVISNDGTTMTMPWTVTLTVPKGGLPAGTTIEDDVTKNQWDNTNVNQWMSYSQIIDWDTKLTWTDDSGNLIGDNNTYTPSQDQVTFLASNGNTYTYKQISKPTSPEEEVDYSALTYTKFTICFPEGLLPPEGATKLTFTYYTTVDLTKTSIGKNTFYNDVKVGNKEASADYTYHKPGVIKTDGNGNTGKTTVSNEGVLTWKIKAIVGAGNKKLTLIDTLPGGVTLESLQLTGWGNLNMDLSVEEESISGTDSTNQYTVSGTYKDGIITLTVMPQNEESAIQTGAEFTLTVTCKVNDAENQTASKTLTNTAKMELDGGEIGSSSQTQEWTYQKQEVVTKVVDKSGGWDNDNRIMNYTVILNQEGKDLVEGSDTLTLVDEMTYSNQIWLSYPFNNVIAYSINAALIQSSVKLYKASWSEEQRNWVAGEAITDWSWVYEAKTSENVWESNKAINTITATGIPDGMPLMLQYSYRITCNVPDEINGEKTYFDLNFNNTAKLEGTNYSGDHSSSDTKWEHSSNSAGVTTDKSYTFYKVEAGNYNVSLAGAIFSVYQYDTTDGSYSKEPVKTYATNDSGSFHITRQEKDANGNVTFSYDTNTLYKVVETAPPQGYRLPDSIKIFYFYFSSSEDTARSLPDNIPSDAVDLSNEARTVYVENVKNTTEITVKKKWQNSKGEEISPKADSVTINLYQKTSQSSSSGGESGGGDSFKVEVGIKDENNKYVYVQDSEGTLADGKTSIFLPSGTTLTIKLYCEYGSSAYDWAQKWKESSATANGIDLTRQENDDGNTYIFTYQVTGETVIDVFKNWGDEAKATVIIDQSTAADDSDSGDNSSASVTTEGILCTTIILGKDNNWTYTFTDLPLTGTDEGGNAVTYYYYIEEVPITNYDTSYENNGGIQTGTITVINKATETPEYELPETGGSGTALYTLGGLLLTAAAILLLYKKQTEKGGRHT